MVGVFFYFRKMVFPRFTINHSSIALKNYPFKLREEASLHTHLYDSEGTNTL